MENLLRTFELVLTSHVHEISVVFHFKNLLSMVFCRLHVNLRFCRLRFKCSFCFSRPRVQSCQMSDEEYYLEPMCIALLLRSQSPLPPPVNKQLTANTELAVEYLHLFQRSEPEIAMKVLVNSSSGPKETIKMLLVSDSSLFMHFWFGMFFLV